MSSLIGFPPTVDERAARVVAGGVVAMTATSLASDQPWLMAPVAAGFAARVLTGPRLSPLGRFATRVVVPRLPGPARPVSGAPKRLAQAMGLTMSVASLALAAGGRRRASRAVRFGLVGAAGLEAFAGLCLACKMFPLLVRVGLASEPDCPECTNVWRRLSRRAPAHADHTPFSAGDPAARHAAGPVVEPADVAMG
ncbi:MAG: DUF4395 domain-containing protein [Acidimicrobiaceae bacterium]|nr:DUF4395 domain-containing protein [Acidimicrobiaceae bacterium]MBO0748404.1 DUF4395 domain-containing protein [Acidimicrobiaceae bacterium]